jgi:hypothetical protein
MHAGEEYDFETKHHLWRDCINISVSLILKVRENIFLNAVITHNQVFRGGKIWAILGMHFLGTSCVVEGHKK